MRGRPLDRTLKRDTSSVTSVRGKPPGACLRRDNSGDELFCFKEFCVSRLVLGKPLAFIDAGRLSLERRLDPRELGSVRGRPDLDLSSDVSSTAHGVSPMRGTRLARGRRSKMSLSVSALVRFSFSAGAPSAGVRRKRFFEKCDTSSLVASNDGKRTACVKPCGSSVLLCDWR